MWQTRQSIPRLSWAAWSKRACFSQITGTSGFAMLVLSIGILGMAGTASMVQRNMGTSQQVSLAAFAAQARFVVEQRFVVHQALQDVVDDRAIGVELLKASKHVGIFAPSRRHCILP